MSNFDLANKQFQKPSRFRRPEFQQKLARARKFQRQAEPVPQGLWLSFLRRLGLRSVLARVFALLLILGVAYLLAFSPIFLVRKVTLAAGTDSEAAQIRAVLGKMEQTRKYLIPSNSIFLLNRSDLLRAIQRDLPAIRQLSDFALEFPDGVKLGIKKREPQYVWQSGSNYYFLDQDGVVFQQIAGYASTTYSQTLIADRTAQTVQVGEDLGIKPILQFIQTLQNLWAQQVPETAFASFSLPTTLSLDLFVKTSSGFQVYFDLNRPVRPQLANLHLLLSQEIKPETYSGLSYIDLRLPTVAYYCYKDAPCAPENQPPAAPLTP